MSNPSSFSKNLGLELIPTGDQAGTWGFTTNENLGYLDEAIDGIVTIDAGAAEVKVTTVAGGASNGRNKILRFEGTMSRNCVVKIEPSNAEKWYCVIHAASSVDPVGVPLGYPLIFSQGEGRTYTLQMGYSNIIYCDGLAPTSGVWPVLENLQVVNLKATGKMTLGGPVDLTGSLKVTGNTELVGSLSVSQNQTIGGTLVVTGAVTLNSTVGVASSLSCGTFTAGGVANFFEEIVQHVGGKRAAFVSQVQALGGFMLNIGGDANYDMYCRQVDGLVTRIPIGVGAQYLRVHPSGGYPFWAGLDVPMGTPLPNGAHAQVLFNWGGALGGGNLIYDHGNEFLGIGTLPSYQLHVKGGGYSIIGIDSGGDKTRAIRFMTGGVPRFQLGATEGESPGAGSDFAITRWNDAVTAAYINFKLVRASGNVIIGTQFDLGSALCVTPKGVTEGAIAVRRLVGQTGPLLHFQHENGNAMSLVDADGKWVGPSAATVQNLVRQNQTGGSDVKPQAVHEAQIAYVLPTGTPGTSVGGFYALRYGMANTWGTISISVPPTATVGAAVPWIYRGNGVALTSAMKTMAETQEEYRTAHIITVDEMLAIPEIVAKFRRVFGI